VVVRVTSNRRVTIPAESRRLAGLRPGTELTAGFEDGVVRLAAAGSGSAGAEIRRMLDRRPGSTTAGRSADEVMALTRCE
jgi:AbrB family looped-hinge helix DNA binding protein